MKLNVFSKHCLFTNTSFKTIKYSSSNLLTLRLKVLTAQQTSNSNYAVIKINIFERELN